MKQQGWFFAVFFILGYDFFGKGRIIYDLLHFSSSFEIFIYYTKYFGVIQAVYFGGNLEKHKKSRNRPVYIGGTLYFCWYMPYRKYNFFGSCVGRLLHFGSYIVFGDGALRKLL